jgi:hypothetical protein
MSEAEIGGINMYGRRGYEENIRAKGFTVRRRVSASEVRGMVSVLTQNLAVKRTITVEGELTPEEIAALQAGVVKERKQQVIYLLRGIGTWLSSIEYSTPRDAYYYWENIHEDLKELRKYTAPPLPPGGESENIYYTAFSVLLQSSKVGMENALWDIEHPAPLTAPEAPTRTPETVKRERPVRKPRTVVGEGEVEMLIAPPAPTPPPVYYQNNPYHMSGGRCRTCGRYGCEGGAACEMAAESRPDEYDKNPRHASGAWYPEKGSAQAQAHMARLMSLRGGQRRPLTRARMAVTRTFGREGMEVNPRSVKCPLCGEITTIPMRPRGTQYCKVCNGSFGATEADPRRKKRKKN